MVCTYTIERTSVVKLPSNKLNNKKKLLIANPLFIEKINLTREDMNQIIKHYAASK